LGADPLKLALAGGEDYVLLFTLPPELAPPPELGGRRIGTMTRPGLFIVCNGVRRELPTQAGITFQTVKNERPRRDAGVLEALPGASGAISGKASAGS